MNIPRLQIKVLAPHFISPSTDPLRHVISVKLTVREQGKLWLYALQHTLRNKQYKILVSEKLQDQGKGTTLRHGPSLDLHFQSVVLQNDECLDK